MKYLHIYSNGSYQKVQVICSFQKFMDRSIYGLIFQKFKQFHIGLNFSLYFRVAILNKILNEIFTVL